jgi:hypothetical protein
MRLTHKVGCYAMILLMLMLAPMSVAAQAQEETTVGQRLITSTVTIGTTASVLLMRFYYAKQQTDEIDELERKIKLYEQLVSIERYIDENPYAVAEAISLGGGRGMRDLATIMLVPDADYVTWALEVRQDQDKIYSALHHARSSTQCAQQLHHVMTRALARVHAQTHYTNTTASLLQGGAP